LLIPSLKSPSPYWCWISGSNTDQIVGEYLWLWLVMLVVFAIEENKTLKNFSKKVKL